MLRPLLTLTILLSIGCEQHPSIPEEECKEIETSFGGKDGDVDTVLVDCPIIPK